MFRVVLSWWFTGHSWYHSVNATGQTTKEHRMSQLDQLVTARSQVCDRDSPLLLDVLGHRLQLLSANVNEFSPVVNYTWRT